MSDEAQQHHWEWEVYPHTCELQSVVIHFSHADENGVESYTTDMCRSDAIAFAEAIIRAAEELEE